MIITKVGLDNYVPPAVRLKDLTVGTVFMAGTVTPSGPYMKLVAGQGVVELPTANHLQWSSDAIINGYMKVDAELLIRMPSCKTT